MSTFKVHCMAMFLSIANIIIGIQLVAFGIADRFVDYGWTGPIGFGIWNGIWVSIGESLFTVIPL